MSQENTQKEYQQVLDFWFTELTSDDWFKDSKRIDPIITERFKTLHNQVVNGKHDVWQETPEGALALVIVLDQFSRNMYRGKPESFKYDQYAHTVAEKAVNNQLDEKLNEQERLFLYMPYMHSESMAVHKKAVQLFESLENKDNLKFELSHKRIIDKFGRYPHRNEILSRESNPEEIDFLENDKNSSF